MKQFFFLFVLPMSLILATLLWAGGCIQPNNGCVRPRVLVFSASWCVMCQQDKVELARLRTLGVEVQVINIDTRPDLARKYGVTTIPVYFVYVCGRDVQRTTDVIVVVNTVRSLYQ